MTIQKTSGEQFHFSLLIICVRVLRLSRREKRHNFAWTNVRCNYTRFLWNLCLLPSLLRFLSVFSDHVGRLYIITLVNALSGAECFRILFVFSRFASLLSREKTVTHDRRDSE
ncbi:hypothetical protein AR158_c432R [Paramecium bursaria Chlorella virus AR158]|uniref:hypothetical protein n=1 Tax=Paramecium bursaria Chlorella virus AR158 TaxID=380598 RepID=UPI00015AA6D6|nr:hypothetical protein AR158_c432R [Paramecium bursaria Chlorella virus AR158]ABU43977.1 hypothetical protein AR158_c432R [Paramecium bursaria Chlorella virus AR158]